MDDWEVEVYKRKFCDTCCITKCTREKEKVECCEAQDYADKFFFDLEFFGETNDLNQLG